MAYSLHSMEVIGLHVLYLCKEKLLPQIIIFLFRELHFGAISCSADVVSVQTRADQNLN